MKIRFAVLAVCAGTLFLTQSYVAQAKDDDIVINLPWTKGDQLKNKKKKEGSSRPISNPAPHHDQKSNGKGVGDNESPRPRDR